MRIDKYILLLSCVFIWTSCQEFLDQPQPQQSLPSATAFTTESDIRTGLIGAYNAAQVSDFMATNTTMLPAIWSSDGIWRGSFTSYQDIYNFLTTPDNGEVSGLWEDCYRTINSANLIIQAVDVVEDPALTQDLINQYRGEALFLRAAAHFEMVRYFGLPFNANSGSDLGVPIMIMPVETSGDVTFPERNTVQQVYDQVIADFEQAASLLPDFVDDGRANRFAALSYLADVYFQQGDYAQAASVSAQVLDGPYSLNETVAEFYLGEGSSEEIFVIINTAQDNPGVNGSLPTFINQNGRGGDLIVDPDLVETGFNLIITDAQRAAIEGAGNTVIDTRTSLYSEDFTFIEKYIDVTNNSDNAPIFRLPKIMLIRAESIVRESGAIEQEALDLVNQIRQRAISVQDATGAEVDNSAVAYTAGDFASTDEFLEAIILERRVELAIEGTRFHDLMRLRRDVRGQPWDSDFLRFPIPQRELDANSNLIQNPGY